MSLFFIVFALAAVVVAIMTTCLAGIMERTGFPLPASDRRIGCVDGLRAYLALSVMIHHFFIWVQVTRLGGAWSPPPIHFLNQMGAGGVGLFFMTTGLVFYPRILVGLRSNSWVTIYVTRLFRIVPLVIVLICVTTVIIFLRNGALPDKNYLGSAAIWISGWDEVPLLGYPDSGRINAYVLWSIWYEWLFYLFVLPACAAAMDLVRRFDQPTWLVPATVFSVAVLLKLGIKWLGHEPPGILIYLPLFATGMLAFECQSRPVIREILSWPLTSFIAVCGLMVGMVTTIYPYGISLPLFGFFFVNIACGNSLCGILRKKGALILGECSFGVYLIHGIVIDVLFVDARSLFAHVPLDALPLLLPAVALVVVLVTPITYLFVERPAIRAGRNAARWLVRQRVKLDSREMEIAP